MMNGKCGYVLRPKFMFQEGYNPYSETSPGLDPNDALLIGVRVLAARYFVAELGQGRLLEREG